MRLKEVKAGSGRPAFNSLTLLGSYVGREYVLSFLVSFAFFFFIFFINQILVFAQRIAIRNISVSDMIVLVILFIPQFLMYTIPFGSLTAASMVIGKLSSNNEILAMRSCGINIKRIFLPIVLISVLFSAMTFCVADYLIPFTAQEYRRMYGEILSRVPTVQLESYSSTRFGNRIISNGAVEDSTIYNVLILDDSDRSGSRAVASPKASIQLVDLERLIYRIDLEQPEILITDAGSAESFSLAQAQNMTMYINLSAVTDGYNPITPSQMSVYELKENIAERKIENEEMLAQHLENLEAAREKLGDSLKSLETNSSAGYSDLSLIVNQADRVQELENEDVFSFYYQYYRSELAKKLALSAACTILVILALPLSFFRMKYGRLTGFGLSMFAACLYWFYLFFMHTMAIVTSANPMLYLWAPNVTVFILGSILLWRLYKR